MDDSFARLDEAAGDSGVTDAAERVDAALR